MKKIFIGGLFPDEMEDEILQNSKSVVHYAANIHQKSLIDAISLNGEEIYIVSALTIGSYPKDYKKIRIKGNMSSYKDFTINNVKFNNIWGLRSLSRTKNLKRELGKLITEKTELVYVYSTHTPYLKSIIALKNKANFKICLIVADLPEYMNLSKDVSYIYKILKKIDVYEFNTLLREVDSFIVLTDQMKIPLKIEDRPYEVIEGIFDSIPKSTHTASNRFGNYILYTGTLNEKFGVKNLVEAFLGIDDKSINLVICGVGDCSEYIKEKVTIDSRIHYLGQQKNSDVLSLQNGAKILINPRQNVDQFTKYSFPSKIMEYGKSGRPILCYKLDGIPQEYDNYLVYVKGNSVSALAEAITSLLQMSNTDLDYIGSLFTNFLNNHKSTKNVFDQLQNLQNK